MCAIIISRVLFAVAPPTTVYVFDACRPTLGVARAGQGCKTDRQRTPDRILSTVYSSLTANKEAERKCLQGIKHCLQAWHNWLCCWEIELEL